MTQDIVKLGHGLARKQNVTQRKVQWKIERCVEPGVDAVVRRSPCEKRSHFGITMKDFAHRRQVRVDAVQLSVKIAPERAIHIRKRVDGSRPRDPQSQPTKEHSRSDILTQADLPGSGRACRR